MAEELAETGLFHEDLIFEGPSFLTLAVKEPLSALELKQHLLKWHVLVRVCDNIPGMPQNYVRVQVRPEEQCEVLFNALRNWR